MQQNVNTRWSRSDIALFWFLCFSIFIVAVVFRIIALSRYGLDGDEIFSVRAANSTWHHLFSVAVHDKSHPPLYYAALKLWLAMGPATEAWIRLLSVLFGSTLLLVSFTICRELSLSRADTLLTLLLVAINGLLIYYAQHARMFSMFELFSAMSILMFLRFLERPISWQSFVLFTTAGVLAVYSHYWGWLLIAAQLFIVVLGRRDRLGAMVLSTAFVGLAFAPWALAVAMSALRDKTATAQIAWMGTETPGIRDYADLLGRFDGIIDFNHATTFGIAIFALPVLIYSVEWVNSGRIRLGSRHSPMFWALIIGLPLLSTSFGSYMIKQNLWGARHLSSGALPYFILIGLSLSYLRCSPLSKNILRCTIIAWAIIAGVTSFLETDKKLHWETISQAIAAAPPIPIYASESFVRKPVEYDLGRLNRRTITVDIRKDVQSIQASRFWFIYRNITWSGTNPRDQFRAQGDTIDAEVSTRSGRQEVTALLVHKQNP